MPVCLYRPRGGCRKEESLLFTSSLPRHSLLQILGCWLPYGEPPVRETFRFAPDESQPTILLLTGGNTVRFHENTYMDQQEIDSGKSQKAEFTNQWSVVHLGHIASPCDRLPDSQNRLGGKFMLRILMARHGTYSRTSRKLRISQREIRRCPKSLLYTQLRSAGTPSYSVLAVSPWLGGAGANTLAPISQSIVDKAKRVYRQ